MSPGPAGSVDRFSIVRSDWLGNGLRGSPFGEEIEPEKWRRRVAVHRHPAPPDFTTGSDQERQQTAEMNNESHDSLFLLRFILSGKPMRPGKRVQFIYGGATGRRGEDDQTEDD